MQEYIFFENRKTAIRFLFHFFFPNNKREKGWKGKWPLFFLFHGNPFVEQPKCPIYQLNVTNIPYYKEDRKSEVKVGQFSLNVYWCFSIILRFILNIQDKYFSSVSEFCKCINSLFRCLTMNTSVPITQCLSWKAPRIV